jgi:hypothetical protein
MSVTRPLPWPDLIAAIGENRFALIAEALAQAKTDHLDRDAFLLNGVAGRLLRDLMPGDAPPGTVNAYGALLHMLFVAWERDWPLARPAEAPLRVALAAPRPLEPRTPPAAVCYVQLPERLAWAEPEAGGPHEPLDGVFLLAASDRARVLAVVGMRSDRDGFTTIEADLPLPAPAPAARADGSAPFASVLPGGDLARLLSVVSEHELVALALTGLAVGERAG